MLFASAFAAQPEQPPAPPAASAPAASQPEQPAEPTAESNPATRAAVERGLAWLATQQQSDGSFGSGSQYGRHVAITGLAGLAFLSDGSTPGRGRYAEQVDGAIRFILASTADESGLICAETSYGPMYGHGFATLFLAEVYGMSPREDLREKLRKAVQLIIRTQNDEGGWRYHPVKADADLSVTICQVMALRAARNAGIDVPKSTIDRAISYTRRCQNPDGGFRYMLDSTGSMFPRSAAGVAALFYAGQYKGPEVKAGMDYLMQQLPGKARAQGHYYYGQYYAAQVMYQAGGRYWDEWWPAIQDDLLKQQTSEGYWRGEAGNEYGTAMAMIILQMPNRLLPIFQK
ncbi:MAG: terpene cyclase/mutase family protein [Phycisphaerae bacterium]|nr:terpene cyclase/mutase family protein [Phycisphaerae bacterium]NUQ48094.1 terpene cyclase/mutase family protein [Phycisphaerae bacterium]